MKALATIGMVSPLIALLALAPAQAQARPARRTEDTVLVRFRGTVPQAQRDAKRLALHAEKAHDFSLLVPGLESWRIAKDASVDGVLAALRGDPETAYAAEDDILGPLAGPADDPLLGDQWGLSNTGQRHGTPGADIGATAAWALATGGDRVVVAVLDTGVDWTHPDLAANIWTNPGEVPGNRKDDDRNGYVDDVRGWDVFGNDNDPMDDDGHGTHVAGIIGARGNNGQGIAGIDWNVKIMPLRFIEPGGGPAAAARDILLDTADPVPALAGKTLSGGRLDAARAVAAALPGPGFALRVAPLAAAVAQGSVARLDLDAELTNGFAGEVALEVVATPELSGATIAMPVQTSFVKTALWPCGRMKAATKTQMPRSTFTQRAYIWGPPP